MSRLQNQLFKIQESLEFMLPPCPQSKKATTGSFNVLRFWSFRHVLPPASTDIFSCHGAEPALHPSTRANQETLDTLYNPLLLNIEEQTDSSGKLLSALQTYMWRDRNSLLYSYLPVVCSHSPLNPSPWFCFLPDYSSCAPPVSFHRVPRWEWGKPNFLLWQIRDKRRNSLPVLSCHAHISYKMGQI